MTGAATLPDARRVLAPVILALLCGAVLVANAGTARSQGEPLGPDPGLELVDQTFAVLPGGTATFQFVVTPDVPDFVAPTTTTSTTTTTTSTTTTTTTLPGTPTTQLVLPPGLPPNLPPGLTVPPTTLPPAPLPPELIVQVRAHRPVVRRADVAASYTADIAPVVDLVEVELNDVIAVDPVTGERRITVTVPISDTAREDQLDLPDPGLYPITVQVRRNGQLVVTHTTFLDRLRSDGALGPFTLSAVAAIDEIGTFPTDDERARARLQLEELAALAERTAVALTVSIPPVVATTVLADDPALGARLAAALVGDTVLAAPDLPLDPGAAVAAGLQPEFTRRLRDGEAALLTALPGALTQRAAWLDHGTLTTGGALMLRDLGVQLLVMSNDEYLSLEGSRPGFTDTSLLVGADLPDDIPLEIAVVDPAMSLVDPTRTTVNNDVEDAVRLMAEIGATRAQLGPDLRGFVVTTPGIGIPDPEVLAFMERFAVEHLDVEFAPLASFPALTNSFFIDGAPVSVELPTTPLTDLRPRIDAEAVERLRLADVASMLPDGDPREADWDHRLRTSLTTGIDDVGAAELIDGVRAELLDVRGSVDAPEVFSFTVTGRETTFPLKITNRHTTPLDVVIHLTSDRLTFEPNDQQVTLQPGIATEVSINVVARSNGRFPVGVELRTPAGNRLTEPVELTARVNNLTGLGRVITLGCVLVLLTWWFTHLKRRRRTVREQGAEASAGRHPANGRRTDEEADDDKADDDADGENARAADR
jgi:Family of unknown function (DUF6049)